MKLLFLDESGRERHKGKPSPRPFVLGGLVVDESKWPGLDREYKSLKRKYGISGVVKWSHFFMPKAKVTTPIAHLDEVRRNRFRERLFGLIAEHDDTVVLAAYARPNLYALKGNLREVPDGMYQEMVKAVATRFQYHLQDVGPSTYGMVICDKRERKKDKPASLGVRRADGRGDVDGQQPQEPGRGDFLHSR